MKKEKFKTGSKSRGGYKALFLKRDELRKELKYSICRSDKGVSKEKETTFKNGDDLSDFFW